MPTFRSMLDRAGVRIEAPDANAVYSVFKDFARQDVEGVVDGVLFETGVYGFGKPETFTIHLVRQFTFEVDGEYDRMEQLQCWIHYEPDAELRSLGAFTAWAENFATLEQFFGAMDARPEWTAVKGRRANRLELHHGAV